MADSFKDILITPNRSNTADPKLEFRGGNTTVNTTITVTMYPDANGTLSFDGSVGQLFSITNDLSGSLWSVNDISGIPSIEVLASGVVKIAEYGGNVAIGTASPKTKLHVYTNASGISEALRLQGKYLSGNDGALLRFTNYHASGSVPNAQEYNIAGILAIDDTNSWGGSLNFQTAPTGTSGGSNLATRMTISSSGNVGIGYSTPEYKLDVNGEARFFGAIGGGNGGAFRVYNTSAGATNPFKHFRVNSTGSWQIINSAYSAVTHQFDDNGSFISLGGINAPAFYDKDNTAYYLDPASTSTSMVVAGNVGLGAVPNTWGNGFKAFQLNGASIYANGQNNINIATNVGGGVDGGGNGGLYISSDPAARYQQVLGTHYWLTAPSGTAGNTITFTSKMVLASTGLTVNTDVLAPIYYDKDNTSYYFNGNGTSRANLLNSDYGFQTTTYLIGSRNRIWSFGNADGYGLSYFQGSAGLGSTDSIGIHLGTATIAASEWSFNRTDYSFRSSGPLVGSALYSQIFYDSNNTAYYLDPANTSTSMVVAGNVGIGTTSPGAKLTIVAPEAIRMASASPYLSFYNSAQSVRFGYAQHNGTNLALVNEQAGSLELYTNNTLRATLDASGNLAMTGGGVVDAASFRDYNNTAYYLDPASTSTSMVVAGNVGIGTTNPTYKLDVAGEARIFNDIGSTYGGSFRLYNSATGATNPAKNFRISPTGSLEFINSAYSGIIATLLDDGNFYASTSFQAPIFYDSNNTNYYIDPNGSSILNNVGAYGILDVTGQTYIRNSVNILNTAGTGWNTVINRNGGNSWIVYGGDSVRAPVFYDSDNTAYYINPNGASNVYGPFVINGTGIVAGIKVYNTTGARDYRVIQKDDGRFVISDETAGAERIAISTGGSVVAYTDIRSPIFYDSDNTAYYLDAANSGTALILNGLIQGRSSAATDVNTANDTGSISIRGSSTTVASVTFHRTGAYAMNMGLGTDNVFRIGGWSASNNCFQMTGTGDLTMLGNITAYSDERLKTDIVKIENAVEKIQAINGYSYTRTDTGSKHIGVIAQEVMKVIPEVVMGSEDTHYSVAYGNMVGLLIEAIKEQQDHINRLETKINSLQGK